MLSKTHKFKRALRERRTPTRNGAFPIAGSIAESRSIFKENPLLSSI